MSDLTLLGLDLKVELLSSFLAPGWEFVVHALSALTLFDQLGLDSGIGAIHDCFLLLDSDVCQFGDCQGGCARG